MDNDFLIRNERQEEYRQVENLVRESFWNIYTPGCTEHYVLHCYRDNPDFIPQLDFVMEKEGKLIGQVIFSKAELILQEGTSLPSWTFGPICIHPDYKRKGYGLRLLNYALEKARDIGIGFLCMEGNIDFYKLAGFQLASNYGIHYHDMPPGEDAPFFLAQELIPDWLRSHNVSSAIYSPPKGYFVAAENPEAFEEYERGFAPKEKLRLPGQLIYNGIMETSRIILRPWRESDAPILYKWASDPDAGPRAGWAPHKFVEESLEVIRTLFSDTTNTWAIELKESGEAIGAIGYGPSCECNLPARDGEPTVGYWIAKPYWNRGICTEALGLMIEHIRKMTGIKSIISGHFVDNPASGTVMEKNGFLPTGQMVIDEKLHQGNGRPIRVMRLEVR